MVLDPRDLEYLLDEADRTKRSLSRLSPSLSDISDFNPWDDEDEKDRRRRRSSRTGRSATLDAIKARWNYADDDQEEDLAYRYQQYQRRKAEAEALSGEDEGVLEKIARGGVGLLSTAARAIDWAGAGIRSGLRETVDAFTEEGDADFGEFRSQWAERKGTGELFGVAQYDGDDGFLEKLGKGALAFAGDVALDPLTYATLGASVIGRKALAEGAEIGTRQLVKKTAQGLADEGVERLARDAAGHLDRGILDRIAREGGLEAADLAGKSTDEVVDLLGSLAGPTLDGGRVGRTALEDIAARGVAAEAADAGLRHGSRGVRRTFRSRLAEHADADVLFGELPGRVRGGAGIRSPFGSRAGKYGREELGFRVTGGGGKVLDRLPGVRALADLSDVGRSHLRAWVPTFARSGSTNRLYRQFTKETLEEGAEQAGQAASKWAGQLQANRLLKRQMGKFDAAVKTGTMAAAKILRESGEDEVVVSRAMKEALSSDIAAAPTKDLEALLLGKGFTAAQAKAGATAAATLYESTLGQVGDELLRLFDGNVALIDNYMPRVMADYQARYPKGGGGSKPTHANSRSGAWADWTLDDDGRLVVSRWWTAKEINADTLERYGVKAVEDDPVDLIHGYMERMRPYLAELAMVKEFEAAGLITRTSADTVRVFSPERTRKLADQSLRRISRALDQFAEAGDEKEVRKALKIAGVDASDEALVPSGWVRESSTEWVGPTIEVDQGGTLVAHQLRLVREKPGQYRIVLPDGVDLPSQPKVVDPGRVPTADELPDMARVRDVASWDDAADGELVQVRRYKRADGTTFESEIRKPVGFLADAAGGYSQARGISRTVNDFRDVEATREAGERIGRQYLEAPSGDPTPEAVASFTAMRDETAEQYRYLTEDLGVTVEVVDEDPYADVAEMIADLANNKRIKVLSTAQTGGHPFFSNTENDMFRAVHDAFGHAATGRGFDRHGEEAAWLSHVQMFTDAARPAMTSETRGQNSAMTWITGDFVDQKIVLLDESAWRLPGESAVDVEGTVRAAVARTAGRFKYGSASWYQLKDVYEQAAGHGEVYIDPDDWGAGSKAAAKSLREQGWGQKREDGAIILVPPTAPPAAAKPKRAVLKDPVRDYNDPEEIARAIELERTEPGDYMEIANRPVEDGGPLAPDDPDLSALRSFIPEPPTKFEEVPAAQFRDAISGTVGQARRGGDGRGIGETVHVYSKDEYAGMRVFLSEDGLTGFAVKPDGDLVSAFSHPDAPRGRGLDILQKGIKEGGTKLDAFDEDGFLPGLYRRFGFTEYGRVAWDPGSQPAVWSGGQPDVVFMRLDPERLRNSMPTMRAAEAPPPGPDPLLLKGSADVIQKQADKVVKDLVQAQRARELYRVAQDTQRRLVRDQGTIVAMMNRLRDVSPEEQGAFLDDMAATIGRVMGDPDLKRQVLESQRRRTSAYKDFIQSEMGGERVALASTKMRRTLAARLDQIGAFGDDMVRDTIAAQHAARGAGQEQWQAFMDGFYKPYYGSFKTLATVGRGYGYVSRNVVGGMWNAWSVGVQPSNFATAAGVLNAARRVRHEVEKEFSSLEAREAGARFAVRFEERLKQKYGAERGANLFDAWTRFEENGLGGVHQTDLNLSAFEAGEGQASTAKRGGLRRLDPQVRRDVETIRSIGGEGPLNRFSTDDPNLLQRGVNKITDNPYVRHMGRVAEHSEDLLRFGTFLKGANDYGLDDGGFAASLLVKATQFDYGDLSDMELRVLKVAFPFFIWARNNVPHQFRVLATDPGRMNRLMRFQENLRLAFEDEDAEEYPIPQWQRERFAFVLDQDFADLLDKVPFIGGVNGPLTLGIESPAMDLERWTTSPVQEAIGMVNPLIKVGAESLTGTSSFTRNPLRDEEQGLLSTLERLAGGDGVIDGKVSNAVRGLIPPVGQAERLFSDGRYGERRGTSWLTQWAALPVATLTPGQVAAEMQDRTGRLEDFIDQYPEEDQELVREYLRQFGG